MTNSDKMTESVIKEILSKDKKIQKIVEVYREENKTLKIRNINLEKTLGKGLIQKIDVKAEVFDSIKEIFADEEGDTYILTKNNELINTSVQDFPDWLTLLIDNLQGVPEEKYKRDIIPLLEATGRRTERRKMALSMSDEGGVWSWPLNKKDALKMDEDGTILVKPNSFSFKVFEHLEYPGFKVGAGLRGVDKLKEFIHMDENDFNLFIDILPVFFVPGIEKPILLTQGDPGGGKSWLGTLLSRIIEPSSIMHRGSGFPKTDSDWFLTAREHYLIFMDNLRILTPDQQDKCCRHITGTFYQTRKLYTDGILIRRWFQGILVINGVSLRGLQSDFLERSLPFFVDAIPDGKRIEKKKLHKKLNAELSNIRGSCIAILSKARKIIKDIPYFHTTFRLTEFARWSAACSVARGCKLEDFLNRLEAKRFEQGSETLEQSLIADPLLRFLESLKGFEGTAKQLNDRLKEQEFGEEVGDTIRIRHIPKEWPDDPREFGRQLRLIRSQIVRSGWNVIFPDKAVKKKGKLERIITIKKRETEQKCL